MHRLVLGLGDNKQIVDHFDHNGLNNQKSNLRPCSNSENISNSRKIIPKTSRYKGVCWDKERNKWLAKISINKKDIKIGRFDKEKDAARAYDEAALKYFGEFACTNFEIVQIFKPAPWLSSQKTGYVFGDEFFEIKK
jgi:hypothetical protein